MPQSIDLTTLVLCPAGSGAADDLYQLFLVPAVYRFLADGSAPPIASCEEWVETAERDFHRFGAGLWLLRSAGPAVGGALGAVRLAGFDEPAGEAELTYLLHPRAWGYGIATRMAQTALGIAFARAGRAGVWAGVDRPNVASVAVLERLGMHFRRAIEYPRGPGAEYALSASEFDLSRHPTIALEPDD